MPRTRLSPKGHAYRRTLINPCENEGFHGMAPAHGHVAVERTTARTGGERAARQMRDMGTIENP